MKDMHHLICPQCKHKNIKLKDNKLCQYKGKENTVTEFPLMIDDNNNDSNIDVHRKQNQYMGFLNLDYCVINFKDTIFITVNDEKCQLTDLQASYPLNFSDVDNTICLVGVPHSCGNDIARSLSMKYKIPFYISVNIEEVDENLTNFILSSCLEMLAPIFKHNTITV
ncbi:conserved protein, unknown function [Hepatocystis sp. ex Piliocolobus tephrosceles]|nr:conserved protein, unknown function [Hepatocystis sp. ex Piliocolobus tephrosceles]